VSCTTVLTNIGDYAKIVQQKPYKWVTKMTGWEEDISGIGVLRREFRWGTTNRVRASWMDLTVENLTAICNLDPNLDLYVDFRYTLIGGGPITINDITLLFEQSVDADDPYYGFRPILTVAEKGSITNLTKLENFTFRPYQVNPAVVLYKDLSASINRIFGHDTMYARAVPMAVGKDVVLHEWTLYDVDEPCTIKVIVPNNEFPDSKINFNPFGLDFEMPFEVHIDKNYFESVLGIGIAPQKRDIIYFPLTNRIYEIESSYLFRDFMYQPAYWKVALKKYAPKANRYEPQELRGQLDGISWDSIERFDEEVTVEEEKITKPEQYDPKIGSRKYDPTRLEINDNLVITESRLMNWSNILSESQYDLRSIFNPLENQIAVKYRAKVEFSESNENELGVCAWFKELGPKVQTPKDSVKGQLVLGTVGTTTTPLSFTITPNRNYQPGSLLKITRFNGLSVFGNFVSKTPIVGGFIITIAVRNEIIQFLNTYYQNWASGSITSGYQVEVTYETIMMDGLNPDDNSGWKLSLYASRYFNFVSQTENLLFILPNNIVENNWYAYYFNVNNCFQQISLDLWIRKWNESSATPEQTTDLENIYSKAVIATNVNRSATGGYQYRLPASSLAYTNIRVFSRSENDLNKQIIILNQTIVQDAQYSIIIDNALPRLELPWIGQTK
jgi:hypothetical protein